MNIMKAYKKIVVGFIVFVTILGVVAFYFPVRNIQPTQTSSEPTENYSASLNPVSPTSTSSNSINQTSTPDKAKFEDMSGFSDLNQESNSLKDLGTEGSSGSIDDVFKDLNQ
jgi:hypothetical protein